MYICIHIYMHVCVCLCICVLHALNRYNFYLSSALQSSLIKEQKEKQYEAVEMTEVGNRHQMKGGALKGKLSLD